jgi:hypothetical protein
VAGSSRSPIEVNLGAMPALRETEGASRALTEPFSSRSCRHHLAQARALCSRATDRSLLRSLPLCRSLSLLTSRPQEGASTLTASLRHTPQLQLSILVILG